MFWCWRLSDISALAMCSNLQTLNLSSCHFVVDISALGRQDDDLSAEGGHRTLSCASIVGSFRIYEHSNGRLQYYSAGALPTSQRWQCAAAGRR